MLINCLTEFANKISDIFVALLIKCINLDLLQAAGSYGKLCDSL